MLKDEIEKKKKKKINLSTRNPDYEIKITS
jgi:hypothetical protein